MNSSGKTFTAILFLLTAVLGQAGSNPPVTVVGKLREVMHGDIKAKIRLADLDLNHLYGVGPITEMDGEITIIDGQVSLARVQADGTIRIDHAPTCSAPFLVYSRVSRWSEVKIPSSLVSAQELEQFVEESAKRLGLESEAPFPFLVQGTFKNISFHIVRRGEPGANVHDNRANFSERDVTGRIVGFFSKHDQGIFTHHDSFVHMHLEAESRHLSGHVESFEFEPSSKAVLLLPSPH
jgi:alpha-acetolactate decarboxylase